MKELKANEGYYLTQSADVATEDRIFITAIKGENVSESDWREATQEEKDAFEKEMEEKAEKAEE
jgi:hypothetical protein